MASFCLVHGSTQGPSGWGRLVPELARRGHRTVLVDLPIDAPEASATEYARAIVATIDDSVADAGDAILVGHSASGMFLPFVAEMRRLRHVVYLTALIPEPGRSVLQQFQTDPSMLAPDWIGQDPTKDRTVAARFLFHDCTPEVLEWALTTLRLLDARGALAEACPLAAWPDVASTSILCTGDRTISPDWSRRVALARLGHSPIELPGGHAPHVSRPEQLADVLADIAARR